MRCKDAAEARVREMRDLCGTVQRRLDVERQARQEVQQHCRDMLQLVEKQRSATESSRSKLATLQEEVS